MVFEGMGPENASRSMGPKLRTTGGCGLKVRPIERDARTLKPLQKNNITSTVKVKINGLLNCITILYFLYLFLNQKSVIQACIILHNWMIDADEDDEMILNEFEDDDAGFTFPDWMHLDNERDIREGQAGLVARAKRDEVKEFLFGNGI